MNKHNAEGYPDPTAYEALCAVAREEKEAAKARYRPLVYVCSPFSGDIEGNTKKAIGYCRFAVDNGAIPLAPHLLFPRFMNEDTERDLAMFMDMVLLGRCEEVWVFGETISAGMRTEIDRAEKKHKPVRYFTTDLTERASAPGKESICAN